MFVEGQIVNFVVCTGGWLHRWTEHEHRNSWFTNYPIFNNNVQTRRPFHERYIKDKNRGGDQGLLQHYFFAIWVKCAPQVPEIVSWWDIVYPWPLMPTSTAVQHFPQMSLCQCCCRPVCNIVKIWIWTMYRAHMGPKGSKTSTKKSKQTALGDLSGLFCYFWKRWSLNRALRA